MLVVGGGGTQVVYESGIHIFSKVKNKTRKINTQKWIGLHLYYTLLFLFLFYQSSLLWETNNTTVVYSDSGIQQTNADRGKLLSFNLSNNSVHTHTTRLLHSQAKEEETWKWDGLIYQ